MMQICPCPVRVHALARSDDRCLDDARGRGAGQLASLDVAERQRALIAPTVRQRAA